MSSFELGSLLKIPRGAPNIDPLIFELQEIEKIEQRKIEISYANKDTAPELMYIFNKAYCEIKRMMAQIGHEYSVAKKYSNKRKGAVLLDVAPDILQKKGLKTSEDLRNAILDQDDEYLELLDKVNMLEAAYEYLSGKAKGFEMSYQSAKKVMDANNTGLGSRAYKLTMGVDEKSPDDDLIFDTIGKPRYG